MAQENKCIICGCTDTDCTQCIKKTGTECFWVDEDKDVCSACIYKNYAITMLQTLANASGAEFEDENMAADIIESEIIGIIKALIEFTEDIEFIKRTLK